MLRIVIQCFCVYPGAYESLIIVSLCACVCSHCVRSLYSSLQPLVYTLVYSAMCCMPCMHAYLVHTLPVLCVVPMVMISIVIRTITKHVRIDCKTFNHGLGTYPPVNTYYIRLYRAIHATRGKPIVDSHSIILYMSSLGECIRTPLQHGLSWRRLGRRYFLIMWRTCNIKKCINAYLAPDPIK